MRFQYGVAKEKEKVRYPQFEWWVIVFHSGNKLPHFFLEGGKKLLRKTRAVFHLSRCHPQTAKIQSAWTIKPYLVFYLISRCYVNDRLDFNKLFVHKIITKYVFCAAKPPRSWRKGCLRNNKICRTHGEIPQRNAKIHSMNFCVCVARQCLQLFYHRMQRGRRRELLTQNGLQ